MTLIDGQNNHSSINIGVYGGGLEEPYGRSLNFHKLTAPEVGWHNEMETVRIRLSDFASDGRVDLQDIHSIRFDFGLIGSSGQGHIVLDDLVLSRPID